MTRTIDLYGVPMDLGADRRGVDMGPSAIRIAGVVDRLRALGHEVHDHGNLDVAEMTTTSAGNKRAKYEKPPRPEPTLVFRETASNTNERTCIAAVLPPGALSSNSALASRLNTPIAALVPVTGRR